MTKFMVVPRDIAKTLNPLTPHIVISITDPPPDGEPANLKPSKSRYGILNLSFHDFDINHFDGKYYDKPMKEWAMKPEHANAIWEFINSNRNVNIVIIHCEAGFSRSPSIAMAIVDCMGIPRNHIKWYGNYNVNANPPNQHVYDTMIQRRYK